MHLILTLPPFGLSYCVREREGRADLVAVLGQGSQPNTAWLVCFKLPCAPCCCVFQIAMRFILLWA